MATDYFAELYVAGRFADAGWNVYFPHRDKGFDFIISKFIRSNMVIRPVQVKGKYPTRGKKDNSVYGYVGKLSEMHNDMVLAIPFFSTVDPYVPSYVAYMPRSIIKRHSRGYRCQPAQFKKGVPVARPNYRRFFDQSGLKLIESKNWSMLKII